MLISKLNSEIIDKEVTLQGWIVHIRFSGQIGFIELRDGTGFLQCIIEKNIVGDIAFEELKSCGIESSIILTGIINKHPKKDEFELQTKKIEIVCKTKDYLLGQKEHNPEFLFDNRHLYLRSKSQRVIQRVRNTVIYATYDRFRKNNFIKIDAPIFTPNACEGTSELYEVKHVNGESMFLSQSGQLYIEAAIFAHGKVFDFGPTFRAEKSKTRRHLNEFWMMDAEMAFVDQEGSMQIQEELVYYIIQEVLKNHKQELNLIGRDTKPLEDIKFPFMRKNYTDIIIELQSMGSDIQMNDDLGADDETILMTKYKQPMFVTGYPSQVKAFYMKEDPNNPGFVKNSDLLAPEGVGEVIGGSQREDNYDVLLQKIKDHKLPLDYFKRYLDLREYGSVPHSGFGYGLERLVRWFCGVNHIRETIPFPRYANRIHP